jgi:hypothetical protein
VGGAGAGGGGGVVGGPRRGGGGGGGGGGGALTVCMYVSMYVHSISSEDAVWGELDKGKWYVWPECVACDYVREAFSRRCGAGGWWEDTITCWVCSAESFGCVLRMYIASVHAVDGACLQARGVDCACWPAPRCCLMNVEGVNAAMCLDLLATSAT